MQILGSQSRLLTLRCRIVLQPWYRRKIVH